MLCGRCDNRSSESDRSEERPLSVFFFAGDRNEPVHVHIAREERAAKFWLSPVRRAYNYGFAPNELNRIEDLVRRYQTELLKAWHEYFKPNN
jgi:hypothetical protein